MNHLSKELALTATLGQDERIHRILSEKWIGYTRAREIHQKMEYLLIHPKTHRMPNMLLVAPTNNGKTILLQRFFDAVARGIAHQFSRTTKVSNQYCKYQNR